MKRLHRILLFSLFVACSVHFTAYGQPRGHISGKIISEEDGVINFAGVYLKDTPYGSSTDGEGIYHISAPAGEYMLVVSAMGYKAVELPVTVAAGQRVRQNVTVTTEEVQVERVVVSASGVTRVRESAYNAVAIDTKALQNTTLNLSDALARAPGLKIRESGGVGSNMTVMLDGFTGNHVKVFIDGVPQDGTGSSFSLNNIPVNYAERIEIYKGVVPVGFGTDAIGGVINIVTKKNAVTRDRNRWFVDASYSYGSFNTHKSYVNFGQTLKNGFTYEVNAFQNYSDNNYYVDTPVKQFLEDRYTMTTDEIFHVKRFHDTYHNEAVVGKLGFVGKKWADRFLFGFTWSQLYKEIQTGARQEVVFGGRYREGHSLMPSMEYIKRDLFVDGLSLRLTANYNRNQTDNVDTSRYEYNWFGEKKERRSPGEVSYGHSRQYDDNWNGTATLDYRIGQAHAFTFNHMISAFRRNSRDMLIAGSTRGEIPNDNRKNISGISYRLKPSDRWNVSVFGKFYRMFSATSVAETTAQDSWVRQTRTKDYWGYGAAGTYYILSGLQTKLSYEKACRMPSDSEMFGNNENMVGNFTLKPEQSDNVNFTLGYDRTFGLHSLYGEGGLIYRNTKDYIMQSVGTETSQSVNHGKVLSKGYNFALRYGFSKWVSVGGNFTQLNARNNVKTFVNGNVDITYGVRMPNVPYQYTNADLTFYWHDLGWKGNLLTFSYDNMYVHSFPLYFENLGDKETKMYVPKQFSHNLSVSYSLASGRYNLSFECRNFTDERMYDNFSLQKAGRAFYGKLRVYFGN
ncbi:MAG: TonB-dependent receptor plug domain-containing protein [Alistipes sp.]|nr:TonB-dependent receptor plug domain-containing protein [Alistipes sp.]